MNHDNKHLCLVMFWNFFYTVCRSTFGLHIWFYLLKRLEIEWIKRQVNVWLHRAMLPASFIVVFRWEVLITDFSIIQGLERNWAVILALDDSWVFHLPLSWLRPLCYFHPHDSRHSSPYFSCFCHLVMAFHVCPALFFSGASLHSLHLRPCLGWWTLAFNDLEFRACATMEEWKPKKMWKLCMTT